MVPADPEREARRQQRVQRELDRIQEQQTQMQQQQQDGNKENEEEEEPDLLEFAENFFNDHERSPHGTIGLGTLKRSRTLELMPKSEMLSYYKGASIPNSHVHMYDPQNASAACAVFRELCKFSRGECKTPEAEVQVWTGLIDLKRTVVNLSTGLYLRALHWVLRRMILNGMQFMGMYKTEFFFSSGHTRHHPPRAGQRGAARRDICTVRAPVDGQPPPGAS